MNQKHWQKIYHANVNVCFTAANVTGIKIGITINAGVHGVHANIKKNIRHAQKIMCRILLHVVVKMVDMQEVLLTIQ